jgi:hypothetical protein
MVSPEQLGEQYLTVYHRMHGVVAGETAGSAPEHVTRPG